MNRFWNPVLIPALVLLISTLYACGGGSDSGGGDDNDCGAGNENPVNNVTSCVSSRIRISEFCGVDCQAGTAGPLEIPFQVVTNACDFDIVLGYVEGILFIESRLLRAGETIEFFTVDTEPSFIGCRPPSFPGGEGEDPSCPIYCTI